MKMFLSSAAGVEGHSPCSEGNSGDGAACLALPVHRNQFWDVF